MCVSFVCSAEWKKCHVCTHSVSPKKNTTNSRVDGDQSKITTTLLLQLQHTQNDEKCAKNTQYA